MGHWQLQADNHERDGVKNLEVWCLSDGRPGHFNQSKGIIKALSRNYRVEMKWIEARFRFPVARLLLTLLFNHTRGAWSGLVMAAYRVTLPDGNPDLVVSSGGNTLFLNASLARRYRCRNLFSGGLRKMSHRCFTAYLTLEEDPHENAIRVVLAPTEMDTGELGELRAQLRRERQWESPIWLMAIGGNSGIYIYREDDWQAIALFMREMAERKQIRWLLTTSRRTGKAVEEKLRSTIKTDILLDAVWYASDPRKVMRDFLAVSDTVVCTEDSFSMITEAVSAGRPVLSLHPKHVGQDAFYAWAVDNLVQGGLIARCPLDDAGDGDDVVRRVGQITPLQQSMPDLLAEQLSRYV